MTTVWILTIGSNEMIDDQVAWVGVYSTQQKALEAKAEFKSRKGYDTNEPYEHAVDAPANLPR